MAIFKETTVRFGDKQFSFEPKEVRVGVKKPKDNDGFTQKVEVTSEKEVWLFGKPDFAPQLSGGRLLEGSDINESNVRKTRFGGRVETVYKWVPLTSQETLDLARKLEEGSISSDVYFNAVFEANKILLRRMAEGKRT